MQEELLTSKDLEEFQLNAMVLKFVCEECGSLLITPWNPEYDAVILVCGADRSHRGYTKSKTSYQIWKNGEGVPVYLANTFEKRKRKEKKRRNHGRDWRERNSI